MLVQKLRLQQGWSQQQLAEMSGLSTRTIQRIENGHQPSVESLKSLAAVFDVDFLALQGALDMNTDKAVTFPQTAQTQQSTPDLQVSEEESKALKHVKKIKRFYKDLIIFIVVIAFLTVINAIVSPSYWWVMWVILGWGISFVIRAVSIFGRSGLFSADWEKAQVEKYLNRRL